MLEQALGGIPLGFGIVVEDEASELSCGNYLHIYYYWPLPQATSSFAMLKIMGMA